MNTRITALCLIIVCLLPDPVHARIQESDTGPVAEADAAPAAGAQRNENIPINLIDNNALNNQIGREGIDAAPIEEFSAVRGNYAAGFGGLGRDFGIVQPEESRAYHGSFFERHQNGALNARAFFQVGPVQKLVRNQYGFDFSGPLMSERLSFFLSGEETRQTGYVNGNVLVPLPSERTPTSSDPDVQALVLDWLTRYPDELPNRPEIDPRMLNTNADQTIRTSGGTTRFDWAIDDARRFTFSSFVRDTYIKSLQLVGGQNPNQRVRPQEYRLGFDEQLGPNDTLSLGVNYIRQKSDLVPDASSVGMRVAFSNEIQTLGPGDEFPLKRIRNDFEYQGLMHHLRGDHQIDWGADVRRFQMNALQSNNARGVMFFNPNFGQSAVENLLAGQPTGYRVAIGNFYRGFRNTDFSLFVNDRWRVRPNFTLTLGLRYEFAGAPSEVNGLTTFPHNSDANNFAPRLGFSLALGETVVRGGYGIAFGRVFAATFQTAQFNPPEIVTHLLFNPDPTSSAFMLDPLAGFDPSDTNPRTSLNVLDPDLSVPYEQHYTLSLEHDLGFGLVGRAAYIGSRTWKTFMTLAENRAGRPEGVPVSTATINDRRPDPNYYTIFRITNMGRAYFDAGQFGLESRDLPVTFRVNYTWSKSIDTGGFFSGTQVSQDQIKAQTEDNVIVDLKGPSNFDVRHAFTATYSLPLPTRWLDDWTLYGAVSLRSGTPFTVEIGSDAAGNVDGEFPDRPSILDPDRLHASVDHPDMSQTVLSFDAFSTNDSFVFGRGNLGRNVFRQDGIANFNAAIERLFALGANGMELAFRAEVTNLTNHPQFAEPNLNYSTPSFGQITNTVNAGRSMQFALTLNY